MTTDGRAPRAGAADYLQSLLDLLPPGRAWPREPETVQVQVWAAAAESFARLHGRALDLLERESYPPGSLEMLADWERVLGLPDPCAVAGATLRERRQAVAAKLAARGGQSRDYFIALAEAWSYAITIAEPQPFVTGLARCGAPLNGAWAWRCVWVVAVTEPRTVPFVAGASRCGERLLELRRAEDLECLLQRSKPAHTVLLFNYAGV